MKLFFFMLEVDRGLSAHLLENLAQCASKPLLPKPMCVVTLMKCIVVFEGTLSHPVLPHGLASLSLWRSHPLGRATLPHQHVARINPLWSTPKQHLQTKTSPNLRISFQLLLRLTRPHVAAHCARGTTAHRLVCQTLAHESTLSLVNWVLVLIWNGSSLFQGITNWIKTFILSL